MKRYFIKYIRDGAKSGYDKSGKCYICGSEEGLDFHHFFSLSELVANWTKKLKLNITTGLDTILKLNITSVGQLSWCPTLDMMVLPNLLK